MKGHNMAKYKDKDVFDFCEKRYKELANADNGYHPSKHDKIVFVDASQRFDLPIEDVYKIYDRLTKLVGKIEVAKINRLPKNKQKNATMNKMKEIIINNHDLPYYELEGGGDEPLKLNNEIIVEEYSTIINNIASAGWTLPLTFDLTDLEKLSKHSDSVKELDNYFELFYDGKMFDEMAQYIYEQLTNIGQKQRFEESLKTFKQNMFSSCATVLTTILEGLVSGFGNDPKDVRVMKICKDHEQMEISEYNYLKSLYWKSLYCYTGVLFKKSDFSSSEPLEFNRHWLIHGRTTKSSDKIDCLRLINAISTVISLQQ